MSNGPSDFKYDFKHNQKTIDSIIQGFRDNHKNQTLFGVTGSGKTLMMAKVIEELDIPALIMAPNKTLAAQLYEEFKEYFKDRSVEYFVSYYDYYRPEAYIPQKGLYIEKESSINEVIDKMRHSATKSLIENKNTIIIASVSCIYGIGSYEAYSSSVLHLHIGDEYTVPKLTRAFVQISYESSLDMVRGKFKTQGNSVIIGPSHIDNCVVKITVMNNKIKEILEFDPLDPTKCLQRQHMVIAPNSHHIIAEKSLQSAIGKIEEEVKEHVQLLYAEGKISQADRILEKVNYDIMQLKTINMCKGIENYSRYFTNREAGQHPPNLFEYFPKPYIVFVDESHISVPQVGSMYKGDAARKDTLINYGFRLPSSKDNRPMMFEEWDKIRGNTVFVSATPGEYELEHSTNIVEQVVRPTGLLDPICTVRPTFDQLNDAIEEIKNNIKLNERVLLLTLTKKTAEHVCDYLKKNNLKAGYLHGELDTIERIRTLYQLRMGEIDVLVGINLLREGIDVPECSLICIFEADSEGFLRTSSALIQMIGRAARHLNGRVILYADKITKSMEKALSETSRRRKIQEEYNEKNNLVPVSIKKPIKKSILTLVNKEKGSKIEEIVNLKEKERIKLVKKLEKDLKLAIKSMNFELAAKIRDQRNLIIETIM